MRLLAVPLWRASGQIGEFSGGFPRISFCSRGCSNGHLRTEEFGSLGVFLPFRLPEGLQAGETSVRRVAVPHSLYNVIHLYSGCRTIVGIAGAIGYNAMYKSCMLQWDPGHGVAQKTENSGQSEDPVVWQDHQKHFNPAMVVCLPAVALHRGNPRRLSNLVSNRL